MMILERPEQRRLAFMPSRSELQGRWWSQGVVRVDDSGGHEGWGFDPDQPLEIAGDRVRWAGCGGVTFRFRYLPGGRIETLDQRGAPDCGSDSQASFLLGVLNGNPLAGTAKDGRRACADEGRSGRVADKRGCACGSRGGARFTTRRDASPDGAASASTCKMKGRHA